MLTSNGLKAPNSLQGRQPTSRWCHLALLTIVALSLALALGLASSLHAPAAHAGINGQHVEIITYTGWSATINGCNQNGYCFTTPCIPLPNVDNPINGYWWVGRTVVTIYSNSECWGEITALSEVVPQVQWFNDYYLFDFRPN